MVFTGCDNGGEEPPAQDSYTVAVSPASPHLTAGAAQTFSATLKKNGAVVSGQTFDWSVSGGAAGTKFDEYDAKKLTIDGAETATLTVTATATGTSHTGTATVTIISAQAQGEAIAAIASATDAQAVLAALKAPNTGIDPGKIVDAWAAEYFAGKAAFGAATTAEAANTALDTLNKSIALSKVNAAATADVVRAAILNEAAFTALGDDGTYWGQYSSLSAADKTSVATALFDGRIYANINALLAALQTAISAAYLAGHPVTYTAEAVSINGANGATGMNGLPGSVGIMFIFSAPVDSLGLTAADITVSGDASKSSATLSQQDGWWDEDEEEWHECDDGIVWMLDPITVANTSGSATVSINKAGIESGSKTVQLVEPGETGSDGAPN
jgi:hypothetical protein